LTEIHRPDRGPHEPFDVERGVAVLPLATPTLPPATHTNCIILGTGPWVVVDPASPYQDEQERLLEYLQVRSISPEAVWLTHHHRDHVAAADALRERLGIPVKAHPMTKERLRGRPAVDESLLDGDLAELGDVSADVLHTPGHARGHLAFRVRGTRTLVAGDLVAGQGTIVVDPPEGDMADYLATLGRLLRDGCGAIVPAHGPAIPDGDGKLLEYIAHRQRREEQVLATLAARPGALGRPIDLVPAVYPEVPPYFHPLAARQVLAHLLKLEAEGRVERPDGSRGVPGTPVYMVEGEGVQGSVGEGGLFQALG
jgi:glyoxylase-like metal-dependent hydrolase (beta-lactamase superfamily II)